MATVYFDEATRTFPGGDTPAVDHVTLDIEDGEFLVLVGPSGCGKSTTLRMLAGLEPITAGRILIQDTVRRYTFQRAGDETAQVWQAGYFNDTDRGFHATFDRHVDAVLAALRAGEPPPVHASAGRRALRLAHAAIESFETGRRVAVSD